MNQITFSWPEGKSGAFTTSWDDGTVYDRKLVSLSNRYGIKATWNLNSGRLGMSARQSGWKDNIAADEVASLCAGHEVAVHGTTHPFLWRQADEVIASELIEDRRALERLAGYPVRGMAFPFGGPDDRRVRQALLRCGICYARSTADTGKFELPDDFLYWNPTCHQLADRPALWKRFRECGDADKLFYLWGHSHEFEDGKSWELLEEFYASASGQADIWYATNMEIYEYVTAARALQCSVELTSFKNCAGVAVWFRAAGELLRADPGAVVKRA